jgi:hypothetical protein
MAMTKERMGEIAFALLMGKIAAEGGIKVGKDLRRQLGQTSQETGITREELEDFSKEMLTRFIGKAYGVQQVSLTLSEPIRSVE